jgi:hypothetical protein
MKAARKLKDLREKYDCLLRDYQLLKLDYEKLKSSFYVQLKEKLESAFDRRTMIAESQAEQALALSIRYRDMLLNRRYPVAVGLGLDLKRQARNQARRVKAERQS